MKRVHGVLKPALGIVAAGGIVLALAASSATAASQTAIFAGGCFWCVESDFDSVDGVQSTVSGYIGGSVKNPTYKQVTRGGTGHYEAVSIEFDPDVVSYRMLVDLFFRSVDPTDAGGQFCDRGESYRTAIFVMDEAQRQAALASLEEAQTDLGRQIVTPVLDSTEFYRAEDYHQDYYLGQNHVITRFGIIKQADAYKRYRKSCGRDAKIQELWGTDSAFIQH